MTLDQKSELIILAVKHAVWDELKDQRLTENEAHEAVALAFHSIPKAIASGLQDYRRFLEVCPLPAK